MASTATHCGGIVVCVSFIVISVLSLSAEIKLGVVNLTNKNTVGMSDWD